MRKLLAILALFRGAQTYRRGGTRYRGSRRGVRSGGLLSSLFRRFATGRRW